MHRGVFPYINQDTQFATLAVDPCSTDRISQRVTVPALLLSLNPLSAFFI